MKIVKNRANKSINNCEEGFSYIDLMVSIVIFMIGILALSGALASNLMRSQLIENQLAAKQLALSSLESILAAKELTPSTDYTGWDIIGNVGTNNVNGANRGIFEVGYRPIRQSNGDDGIVGTIDDACSGTGACGTNNTSILFGFKRKIEITDINNSDYQGIRQRNVKVTIQYQSNGKLFEETIKTLMTDYR